LNQPPAASARKTGGGVAGRFVKESIGGSLIVEKSAGDCQRQGSGRLEKSAASEQLQRYKERINSKRNSALDCFRQAGGFLLPRLSL
jgi:hypothetical protein